MAKASELDLLLLINTSIHYGCLTGSILRPGSCIIEREQIMTDELQLRLLVICQWLSYKPPAYHSITPGVRRALLQFDSWDRSDTFFFLFLTNLLKTD